jgi:hypothetical protein
MIKAGMGIGQILKEMVMPELADGASDKSLLAIALRLLVSMLCIPNALTCLLKYGQLSIT